MSIKLFDFITYSEIYSFSGVILKEPVVHEHTNKIHYQWYSFTPELALFDLTLNPRCNFPQLILPYKKKLKSPGLFFTPMSTSYYKLI